jgi:hypothetical protein
MDDDFTVAIENIKKRLSAFSSVSATAPDLIWERDTQQRSVDRFQFPVPNLILFILHGICGFSLGFRGEKTHWVIPFTYRGAQCAISYEKFGVRLYIEKETKETINPAEILGKLRKAIESAERHILTKIAQTQIQSANITIANQFNRLGSRYHYFRERAALCYAPPEENSPKEDLNGIADVLNRSFKASSEGGYNALAMIDAYFSRLEHFLVLALPFTSFDRSTENLTGYVGKIWSYKFKRVLKIEESLAREYYSKLVVIKEKYRNTFAHGGFEKKGASFYFHLPHFGAIPARMSGHKNSVHFNWFPLEQESFHEICVLFDDFDNWLKQVALPSAWKFAESGLDMRFDEKYMTELLSAAGSSASFDEWLDMESYHADMHANADY